MKDGGEVGEECLCRISIRSTGRESTSALYLFDHRKLRKSLRSFQKLPDHPLYFSRKKDQRNSYFDAMSPNAEGNAVMCKHCRDERAGTIQCECKCSDSDWEDSDSQSQFIQQEMVWIKCKECKHYIFLKAASPKVFVEREMKMRESFIHPDERPHLAGPGLFRNLCVLEWGSAHSHLYLQSHTLLP